MNNITPYFVQGIAAIIRGAYFQSALNKSWTEDQRYAVAVFVSSLCLTFEINPNDILTPEDIQLVRRRR